MTTLPIYGGPLKGDLVRRAYGICGQSSDEFELEPDDYVTALMILDGLMGMLEDQQGIVLGYNYPNNAESVATDESGLPRGAVQAVATLLAGEIAPTIGKQLSGAPVGSMQKAMSLLLATYRTTPSMTLRPGTPRGSGRSWDNWLDNAYFDGDV